MKQNNELSPRDALKEHILKKVKNRDEGGKTEIVGKREEVVGSDGIPYPRPPSPAGEDPSPTPRSRAHEEVPSATTPC